MLRKALFTTLAFAAGAALAGCDAPAQLSAVHTASDPWPAQKAGLWAQTLTRDGHTVRAHPTLVCLNGGPVSEMGVVGRRLGARDCDRHVVHGADGAYHFTSACQLPAGARLTTNGRASGDFVSHYRIDADVVVDGAPISALDGQRHVTLEGDYRGPCPPGASPGHLVQMDRQKISTASRAAL